MTKKKPAWREVLEAIVLAFVLAMIIRSSVIEAYKIPSGSMLDTLLVGDRLLANKFAYGVKLPFTDYVLVDTSDPQVGDVMVFAYPPDQSKNFIKRVVGVPGDVIEVRNKQLYRNGQAVQESYIKHIDPTYDPRRDNYGPVTVPADSYFMMGDNRDNSEDSRYWGFLPRNLIKGKAWRIYWSSGNKTGDAGASGFEDVGIRWSRIGRSIQ